MTEFVIEGRCPTKGSTRSFVHPKTGKVVTMADNKKLAQWTKDARILARAARIPMIYKPHGVALYVRVEFVKPKTAKQLAPTVRPDLDKCLRAVLDALTGVAYADDSQVTSVMSVKAYGAADRVVVGVEAA
jgi:crossover junction endodeoxyribonuclease RusA